MNSTGTRPVRVRLYLAYGPGPEIDAYPTPTPGLVIHHSFGQPGDVYTVTQEHSGVALAAAFPSPEAALGAAVDLGALADWTRPVNREALLPAASRIVAHWGAQQSYSIDSPVARAAGAIL